MKNLSIGLIASLCFCIMACKFNNSSKKEIESGDPFIKYQKNSIEILKIMKEGSKYMEQAITIEMKDSLAAAICYKKALNKFLIALAIDTTRKKVGIYLPDLYSKLKMFDSASYWRNWLGPEDKLHF